MSITQGKHSAKRKYFSKDVVSLVDIILSLQDKEQAKFFFKDLLTSSEMKELSNRWKAAKMLWDKTPYSKIEHETGMSSTTIARISKSLKQGNGYRSMIKKEKIIGGLQEEEVEVEE